MIELYPLKFKTIFKDKIWGGKKIKTVLGKDFGDLPNCGETWEVSGVPGNLSIVKEGELAGKSLPDVIAVYKEKLVGKSVYRQHKEEFPLLIKFIDANADLSIQVHPNDEQAKKLNSFGKTEMWYIFQADPGSTLISGFKRDTTREEFVTLLEKGRLDEVLNSQEVAPDDVYFLPAGRVHTIGTGLLLAEIQQTSDITYRVYDFDRVDAEGNKRELHLAEALEVMDFSAHHNYKTEYVKTKNEPTTLIDCPYFHTNRIHLTEKVSRDYANLDSFVIFICMQGELDVQTSDGDYLLSIGEAMLIPASIKALSLLPNRESKLMEVYVP